MSAPEDQYPAEVDDYLREIVARLDYTVPGRLMSVYATGSLALGGFISDQSDIDVIAVYSDSVELNDKRAVVAALHQDALPCPARGLELVVYSRSTAAAASRVPCFEINLNTGPRMPLHVSFECTSEPAHWFVLDIAIVREHGRALIGLPADAVFAPIPREWLLDALHDSLEWHAEHESITHYSVLNACRALRFALENVWSTKERAAEWARAQVRDAALVEACLAIRRGESTELPDGERVRAFVMAIRELLSAQRVGAKSAG
ncbi:MAG: DUF4111 domain-containing protein [Actinomycetota bacterium]|nr:DUF4111 domain-containing protein [Actinomycetota bacterium]